jgi:hypothetical protein
MLFCICSQIIASLAAFPNLRRIVLLGDWRQPPSVRAGNLLTDVLSYCVQMAKITDDPTNPKTSDMYATSMVELTHNYRVQASSVSSSSWSTMESDHLPGLAQSAKWVGESLLADIDHLCAAIATKASGVLVVSALVSPAVRQARCSLMQSAKNFFMVHEGSVIGEPQGSFRNCMCAQELPAKQRDASYSKTQYQRPLINSLPLLTQLSHFFQVPRLCASRDSRSRAVACCQRGAVDCIQ